MMVRIEMRQKVLLLLVAVCVNTANARPYCQDNGDQLNLISTTSDQIGSDTSKSGANSIESSETTPSEDVGSSGAATEAPDQEQAAGDCCRKQNEHCGGANDNGCNNCDDKTSDRRCCYNCCCRCCCCGIGRCSGGRKMAKTSKGELSGKFDHFDYAVSDLEFELVLRRLRSESESTPPKTTTTTIGAVQLEDNSGQEESNILATNKYPQLNPSECFICLGEFDQSDNDSGKSGKHDNAVEGKRVENLEVEPRPFATATTQTEVVSLVCGHKFHLGCIRAWSVAGMAQSHKCPICGTRLRLTNGDHLNKQV